MEDYFYDKRGKIRYMWDSFFFLMKSFVSILFTIQTVIMLVVSVGTTLFCFYLKLSTDMPLALISVAIIFPISFGIGYNFTRRETTLREIASFKGTCLALYIGAREYPAESDKHKQALQVLKEELRIMMLCVRQTLLHNTPTGGAGQVYKAFDDVACALSDINGCDPKFYNTAMYGQLTNMFRALVESYERICVIHDFRTPSALRAYALVWLSLSAVILAPLLANFSRLFGVMSGVYSAILIALMFSGLYRILANEEDPFDATGFDDLSLESLSRHTMFMYNKLEQKSRRRIHAITKPKNIAKDVFLDEESPPLEFDPSLAKSGKMAREKPVFLYFEEEKDTDPQYSRTQSESINL